MLDLETELNPLQRLCLGYAPERNRERIALAFALDNRLADIIRSTSEILIGQMRLTWWRDILTMDPKDRPAGEPLVEAITKVGAEESEVNHLLSLVEGWEYLLEDFPWDDRIFDNYAQRRGEGLFAFAMAPASRFGESQKNAARAWALWDFARHCSDQQMRHEAFTRCCDISATLGPSLFDRSGRPLSILCHLMRRDVRKGELSADLLRPSTALRVMLHGLTGR